MRKLNNWINLKSKVSIKNFLQTAFDQPLTYDSPDVQNIDVKIGELGFELTGKIQELQLGEQNREYTGDVDCR